MIRIPVLLALFRPSVEVYFRKYRKSIEIFDVCEIVPPQEEPVIPEKFADNMQSPGVIAWHKPVPALGFDLRLVVFMGMVPSPVVVVLEVLHLDNQRNGAAR